MSLQFLRIRDHPHLDVSQVQESQKTLGILLCGVFLVALVSKTVEEMLAGVVAEEGFKVLEDCLAGRRLHVHVVLRVRIQQHRPQQTLQQRVVVELVVAAYVQTKQEEEKAQNHL